MRQNEVRSACSRLYLHYYTQLSLRDCKLYPVQGAVKSPKSSKSRQAQCLYCIYGVSESNCNNAMGEKLNYSLYAAGYLVNDGIQTAKV